jgi:hypothetical protein
MSSEAVAVFVGLGDPFYMWLSLRTAYAGGIPRIGTSVVR